MDDKFKIISSVKVDVYSGKNEHTFTYPDVFNPARLSDKDEWLRAISDLRDDARKFKSEEVYAFWKNQNGNYYSIIIPDRKDTREGRIMITVFTGKYLVTNGKQVITTLQRLKQLADGEPNGYYTMTYSGEQIDIAIGDVLNGNIVIPSSTSGSTKKFKIMVDDSGAVTATEVSAT